MKGLYIILSVLLCIVLVVLPVYATRHFNYEFKDDITIICPDCDWWISCESFSMKPTLDCNDTLIVIKPNSRKDIEVGDIIMYRGSEEQLKGFEGVEYVTHRIVDIDYKGCYVTKGDNNYVLDKFTTCFYDIKFKVVGIIYE